ncbi:Thiol-disulfide isomerase or thioredoxin [Arsukibacterium tuosuense]|uniref:Thiol-disulfide isomerase or thioredoxin n=1 Tax=Arsukibacterium tuosuense TaxID=1323745 RepID=A0A285JJ93_9GAMM|nr:TlpA disulfide reductase family protein [Arsukibacterium tuosuense]SNY60369.1 Thiol-disulfide isomerase or thioredoxin [Arsukibacterium tuosuense]
MQCRIIRVLLVGCLLSSLLAGRVAATELSDLEGSPVSSMQQLRGKVVLVDFWASWCVPCRKSFPWLNTMQQQHAAAGLLVLAVNEDSERNEANRFLQQVPAQFAVLYDRAGAMAEQYQLKGMPSSFLIDKKGQIRYRHIGFKQADIADYEAKIRQLLAEE